MSRVYELAKKFNIDNKLALEILKKRGFKVSNNFSSVGDAEYEALKEYLNKARNKGGAKQGKGEVPKKEAAEKKSAPTAKTEAKPEVKSEVKPEVKIESKTETKQETKSETKVEVKNVTKPKVTKNEDKPKETKETVKTSVKNSDKKSLEAKATENRRSENNDNRDSRVKANKGERENREEKRKDKGENNRENSRSDFGSDFGNNERSDRNDRSERNRKDKGEKSERSERNGEKGKGRDRDKRRDERDNRGEERIRFSSRKDKKNKKNAPEPPQKVEIARPKHIKVGESIVVKDLASKMSVTAAEVIKKLMAMKVLATINQVIDFTTAALVAEEFGVTAEELPPEVDPTEIPEIEDDAKTLKHRPPVVTVMGHVDHGKTSLLDVIRKTSVSAHEAGGITQHIGAYQVMCKDKKIVFLDTPGHEAFTAMRARGAQVTDIAILVVAADDGVMPQTIEAIHHAKSANVPIIVAINKIDKPGANPDRVKQELMEKGLVPEEYGGDTIMVPVSAKQKMGISDLLEMVLIVAEMQELKANPNREARGVIIEAELDKGRGPVATVLVQSGTLRIGDSIIAGTVYGKVRAMVNDRGDNVKKAGPSVPVEVLGFNDVPAAGDLLAVLDEKQARSIAAARQERQRTQLMKSKKVSLDDLFQQIQAGNIKDLNIVIKADVQGSVEALTGSLLSLNKNDEVRVSIVHSGVGAVSESDVMLASASNALIIAFNVRPDANARKMADAENIDIRTYRVIYDALNDVKDAMSGMLAPKYKEVVQGHVEIRQVMKFSKALVAGSYVLDGKIFNNSKIRIIRDNIEIFDGEIDSLRRFKDEVKEVAAGYECGISIIDFRDFREGDIIEPYTMEEIEVSIQDANREASKRREEAAEAKLEAEIQAEIDREAKGEEA